MFPRLLIAVLALFPLGLFAGVPDERFARLSKGVNLSHWYAQSVVGHYQESHLSSYFTEQDAERIHAMGFRHVRFTLNDSVVFDPAHPGVLRVVNLPLLRQRMHWFLDRGIAVVLDLHPEDAFKKALTEEQSASALVENWVALARAMKDISPDWLFFEFLNEPHTLKGEAWFELQRKLHAAVRAEVPEHTLILTGDHWSGVDNLVSVQPVVDSNVVYTFHCYEPFIYTHQQANWTWEVVRSVAGLDWPADPEAAETLAARHGATPEAVEQLRYAISNKRLTTEFLTRLLDRVSDWQAAHGNPRVYVGEFGVYKHSAPDGGRVRWHAFLRNEFERRGWGWAVWDYAGGFNVLQRDIPNRQPDSQIGEALGLDPRG